MKNIEINPTTEFHILRHFLKVSQEYKDSLIGKDHFYFDYSANTFKSSTISEEDVNSALVSFGGKFLEDLTGISSPTDILQLCKVEFNLRYPDRISSSETKHYNFEVTYSDNLGLQNFLEISKLTLEEKSKIQKIPRSKLVGEGSIIVNVLDSDRLLNSTKIIAVEVVDTPELPFLWVTAHPVNHLNINEFLPFWDQVVILI